MRTQRIDLVLDGQLLDQGAAVAPAFVTLHTYPNGSSVLSWNDGFLNEWLEEYPTLSLALVRLAALARCAENDFHSSFTGDRDAFIHRANWFLDQEVS